MFKKYLSSLICKNTKFFYWKKLIFREFHFSTRCVPITHAKRIQKNFSYPAKTESLKFKNKASSSTAPSSVKDLLNSDPDPKIPVCIQAWVRSVRAMKHTTFMHVYDGSSQQDIQIVIPSQLYPLEVTFGSCIQVHGVVQASKSAGQEVELMATEINVIGACDNELYPIKARQQHSMDYLRTFPHLRVRTKAFSSITRVRNAAFFSAHQFFQDRDFQHIHTPILTTNDCEGAGEVFSVQPLNACADQNSDDDDAKDGGGYFGQSVYLTVSGQLHLEAMTGAFTKTYTFGPTFRAENNFSRHHLCEFSMLEAEVTGGVAMGVGDLTELIEDLIKHMTSSVMKRCHRDVTYLCNNNKQHLNFVDKLINSPYARITYSEAIDILEHSSEHFGTPLHWGIDLNKEMEKYLAEKHFDHVPVFISDFPAKYVDKEKTKPFYARMNEDGLTVASCDLLMSGVGEVCGGGMREERIDFLRENIRMMRAAAAGGGGGRTPVNNITSTTHPSTPNHPTTYPPTSNTHPTDPLEWYVDLRRFGGAPHGGFGLGFERYLQGMLGLQSIRDALPFPRAAHLCKL